MTGAQVVHVVIDATDDVALASVSLTCNPAVLGCETRAVSPPAAAAHQTFDITIPAGLQAPQSVALSVIATDTSGNAGAAGRVLQIADTIKPSILSLASASGSTHLAVGDVAVLRAAVSDNVGVTALAFATDGAFSATDVATVSPVVTNGVATLSVAVPITAPNGATFTVHVRARDAAGNASDEASLTFTIGDAAPPSLTVLDPAEGTAFVPGGNITVRVHATDDVAVRRFTLSVTGAFTATDTRDIAPPATPADATFVVPVPTGAAAGLATLHLQTIDTSGNASATVDRNVTIADIVAPQVQIVSPAPNARLDPRNPVAVTIAATDAVGVSSISFGATGTVAAAETRTISPAASTRTETFTVNVSALPVAGGTLTVTGSARDAAGNSGIASTVTVQLDDVVAPDVLSTTPADGATGVDPLAAIAVHFTEPMNLATLTAASIQLRRGATVIPTSIVIGGNDDVATLTPTAPLQTNATFTIVISTTAADRAGNPLTAPRTLAFTTASPDHTSPKVVSIDPASNAVDVSLVTPIVVTFTEPVDPSSINPQTFKVQVGSSPVAGSTTLLAGNTSVRFAPSEPLPPNAVVVTQLTGGITDAFSNPLVAADGSPLATPLTFTFATARFSLVSPAGSEIVENSSVLLEARADAALGAASVVFSVNGQPQPSVAGPPFTRTFAAGAAASTPTLTILARALDSGGAEIARDERSFNVVVGLRVTPVLAGVPLGRAGVLRFSVSSALSSDLPIALTAGDATLVTFPVNPAVLPAGQTFIDAAIVGASAGATAIIGSSPHGNAVAIVAVSQAQVGQTLTPIGQPAGIAVSNPPSAGAVVVQSGTPRVVRVLVLDAPATGNLAVTVSSTNAAVATATATPVGDGQQTTDVQITPLADGVATIIFRVGNLVRALTVYVGAPPAGSTLLLLASPAGVAVSNAPSAGQVITAAGGHVVVTVQLLNAPAVTDTAVTVATSNAAVASGIASVIHAGQTTTSLSIDSTVDGIATFTLRAGGETRAVTIFVGVPPANAAPILVARSIGVSVASLPSLGRAFAPTSVARTLTVRLFNSPALVDTPVTVTTNNASVATAGPAQVRAGEQSVNLDIVTGSSGTATLTIEAAGVRRELTIVVGSDPTPGSTAPIVAAPVGVTVIPNPAIGRAFGAAGSPSAATLGISLLDAAATGSTTVTITSGNPEVATLNGASTTTIDINAGDRVLQLPIFISGTEGAALLTLEFNGQRRELLIVVGNPPASAIPAVTAPIVGIRIG